MSANLASVELDARRNAEAEVALLLRSPADLKRLASYREAQQAKQQAVRQQLSATISNQVEGIRGGLELLDRAQKAILRMKMAFEKINMLCAECNTIIQHHDRIQRLAAVHYNLSKTLQYAEHMRELPDQAREAEMRLADESQLLQVYELLSVLECTSIKTRMALEAGAKISANQTANLNAYFKQVNSSINRFEERLWSIIRNFMAVSQSQPWLLTDAVRVIETQERVDKHLQAAMEAGLQPVVQPRHYRRTAERHFDLKLEEKFAPLQQRCSILVAAGENTKERVMGILAEADEYVSELTVVYDRVAPCFPAHYQVFDVIRKAYHRQIGDMLDVIGVCSDHLANSDILDVIGWVEKYLLALDNLGVDPKDAALPDGPNNGMPLLIAKYMERTRDTLKTWYQRVLEIDMSNEPKEDGAGHAYTPGVQDLFQGWNEQLSLLEPINRGDFLLKMAQVLLDTMREYQDEQCAYLTRLDVEDLEAFMMRICAVANNGKRCVEYALRFKDDINQMLEDRQEAPLLMERELNGFVAIANFAIKLALESIMQLKVVMDLFTHLYCTPEWYARDITNSVLATLDDLLGYRIWMEDANFEIFCAVAMSMTVQHYLAAALDIIKNADARLVEGLAMDIQDLDTFFRERVGPDMAATQLQPLVDVKTMLAADGEEAFLLAYSSLLQACPGVSPAILEKIIYARSDLGRAEVRKIAEQCREKYIDRQRALTADEAAKLKPTAKETGFARALLAAKRMG